MQTMTSAVSCPLCDQPGTITMFRGSDPTTGVEHDKFEFTCLSSCRVPEDQLVHIWVASKSQDPRPDDGPPEVEITAPGSGM